MLEEADLQERPKIRKKKIKFDELGVLGAVIILGALLSFGSPYFLTMTNLLRVGRQMAYIGILAVGMAFVIGSGQIDISCGRIITLVTFFSAWLINSVGVNPWLAFIAGILLGGLCGLLNGGLSLLLNVNPMIVTLGTQYLFWGLAIALSDSKPIVLSGDSSYYWLGQGELLGVPVPLAVFLICVLIGQIVLCRTCYGRHVLAVGSNAIASRYAGIRDRRVLLSTMVLMGLLAGLSAGVILAQFQAFDPNTGAFFEMNTIASAVIGGADLSGGYASVLGAMFGTVLIGVLNNGLILMGISAYWNKAVTGSVILIAVAVSAGFKASRK